MLAENRFAVQPSVSITGVSDSNLFFTPQASASDRILRIRPGVEVLFASPRLTASADYNLDSDRYATHGGLSNRRARQSAATTLHYQVSPRLDLGFDGTFTDTDTPAELNITTGLGFLRQRAKQTTFAPAARLRISSLLTTHASLVATDEKFLDGARIRSQMFTAGADRRITARDTLSVGVEQGHYDFNLISTANQTNTSLVRASWNREIDSRTHFTLSAGPRFTSGTLRPELAASLAHRWLRSSLTLSASQTQTTALGINELVQVRAMDARVVWDPTRSLSAYVNPAVFRTDRPGFQATAYHAGVGARYAVTPFVSFDAIYSFDSQHGVIDPLHSAGAFSRSTLAVGFSTRWSAPDVMNGGPR